MTQRAWKSSLSLWKMLQKLNVWNAGKTYEKVFWDWTVLGHSMGAGICSLYSALYPEKVKKKK